MKDPFFGATTPDGRWTIRVTEDAEPGWYFASVVLDGLNVVDSLTTEDTNKLVHWVHRQMKEAMRRSGA